MWDYNIEHEPTPSPTPTKPLGNFSTQYRNADSDEDTPPNTEFKCLATSVKDPFDAGFAILDCASGTHLCKVVIPEDPDKIGNTSNQDGIAWLIHGWH